MCRLVQAEENVADAGGLSHIIYVWITKSVCSLPTAEEAGGLCATILKALIQAQPLQIMRGSEILLCVLLLFITRDRKKVFGPGQGMSHS